MTDPKLQMARSLLQRDPLALAMFAAWVNLPADKLPPEMRAHTCEQTAKAWERVATAVRSWLLSEERVEAAATKLHTWHGRTSALICRNEAMDGARAALSSAIGEPYEFSGWVEVVEDNRA